MRTHNHFKTIAFDCFGTLAHITRPAHPFRHLAKRSVSSRVDPRQVMCYPWSLAQAASELEIALSPAELQELEAQLLDETASIELYEETREVLTGLRSLGYRIAVCSNLALPYADPIEALVGDLLDIRVWSFQAGAIKPSPQIYERLLEQTGHTAAETLMVGDSLSSDYEGARAAGLSALHLVRDTVPVHDTQIRSLTEVLNVA